MKLIMHQEEETPTITVGELGDTPLADYETTYDSGNPPVDSGEDPNQ